MDIDALAVRQLHDYDHHHPGTLFAGNTISMTVDDAYALQFAVSCLRVERGEPVAGYKVGCISPIMQAQLALDRPVFGFVFETELHSSGTQLNVAHFDGLAIEGEFAVRLAADIPDAAWLLAHPHDALASAFAVIELHNYVFRNEPHDAQELIGNNAIHAGVIMPQSELPLVDPTTLLDAGLQVSRNGIPLGEARGRNLPEGPFHSVVRLAEHLARFHRILQRGQIVLTGSPLPLYRVTAGDRVEVSSDRFETVTMICR